jgi:hypothetical protein
MEKYKMCTLTEALYELENVDNTTKNKVENELVSMGASVVPSLVDKLQVVRGIKRGVVAMTLIRIGDASVECLKKAAKVNEDFKWVAEYLIREIKGSKAA